MTRLFRRTKKAFGGLTAFRRDSSGVSAIEFALIVPIFLAMYLGAMELGQGIETNKKVGRAAAMVADLVTQEKEQIKAEDLDAIMQIGESILLPYSRSRPTTVVAGIQFNNANPAVGTVTWQKRLNGTASADCANATAADVPLALQTANNFVIRVQTCLPYQPVLTWDTAGWAKVGFKSTGAFTIRMGEVYFFRPRMSEQLSCIPASACVAPQ